MKNKIFMGIDTSNYTTSVAFVDGDGQVISEKGKLLTVKHGERGLRQSDAFYQHCFNLPEILEEAGHPIDYDCVSAIGVSTRPRNVEGSYMPVFKCGENFARFTGTVLKVPVLEFSHQEGHVKAITSFNPVGDQFIAYHLSGGTNEILKINTDTDGEMTIDIIGKTLDISMGQLIDRVGVKLGLDFPAGQAMDQMALKYLEKLEKTKEKPQLTVKPIPLKGLDINVSGIETQLLRNESNYEKGEIAYVLFSKLVACLEKQIQICKSKYPELKIVFAGGVSKSRFLRKHLQDQVIFGKYSSDNAVGTALLARDKFVEEE